MTSPVISRSLRVRAFAVEATLVALGFALVTLVVWWPQTARIATEAHGHHDALFSMWRLSWIAHALSTAPTSIFDAPIFWPVRGTLAFSDAVLLQGLVAWPWLAAGVPVLPVYNVLLLAGPWSSAIGAYVLARRLTSSRPGAVVAGLVFGFAPYRIEHAMHLELQWSQWMPLALWSLHRTWARGRLVDGAWTGVFVLLQFLSCIYYGVFLVLFMALLTPMLWWQARPAAAGRVVLALTFGAVLVAPGLVAYGTPYRQNQATLGTRGMDEIAQWSARPVSYLSSPIDNRVYGAWTWSLGAHEARLFPGAVAIGLSLVALWRPGRLAVVYAWGGWWAMVLSWGTNTPVYGLMLAALPPLQGLRAPARFAMLVMLAVGVLAALGVARLDAWWRAARPDAAEADAGRPGAPRMTRAVVLSAAVMLVVGEYASHVGPLHAWPQRAPMYANWLATQPRGVVLELPAPVGHALPLYDAEWSFLGRFHGHPLVNGYSGYFPRPYFDLLGAISDFPSDESLWVLGRRDVRYVVLHEDRYPAEAFLALLGRIERFSCLHRVGRFPDPVYPVSLYELHGSCVQAPQKK